MKRMKKKVVAMVTLAMFIMTLLPMAAFAAPANSIDAAKSTVSITPAEVAVKGDVEVTVTAKDLNGSEITTGNGYNQLYFWFESKDGAVYKQVNIAGENAKIDGNSALAVDGSAKNVKVSFNEAGTYELKAGVAEYAKSKEATTADELTPVAIENGTITVKAPTTDVSNITVTANTSDKAQVITADGVTRNIIKANVTGTVFPEGTVLTIDNTAANSGVYFVDTTGKPVTEYAVTKVGDVDLLLVADKTAIAGTYEIGLACGNAKAKLFVKIEAQNPDRDTKAATIEAGDVDTVFVKNNKNKVIKNVNFVVKNAAGENISDVVVEPFAKDVEKDGTVIYEHDSFLTVTGPKTVKSDDITFVWDADAKAMVMNVAEGFNKVFDKAGEYTITATLLNGQTATVKLTVVDAAGAVDRIEIVPDQDHTDLVLDDSTGAKFEVKAYDKNGLPLAVNASNLKIAYTPVSADVVLTTPETQADNKGSVKATLKQNADKDAVLGTKVDVLAVYTAGNRDFYATYEYTIVDKTQYELADYALTFDSNEGDVLKYNTVVPTVAHKDNSKKTETITNLYVNKLSQSNKDAKVAVSKNSSNNIVIYSDKATTVDVQVVALVKTTTGFAKFANTLTYNVGVPAQPELDNTLVALTIGSKGMIVNNEVVKVDAAPYVNKDYRTMVPLSAITEAFGVIPDWNEKDRTVTVEMNGVKIVMTIDKQTYTVNGKEAKMDTAPVINNSRTMVPVRFIAEELGFKVTPVMSDKGLTEGVVITK